MRLDGSQDLPGVRLAGLGPLENDVAGSLGRNRNAASHERPARKCSFKEFASFHGVIVSTNGLGRMRNTIFCLTGG